MFTPKWLKKSAPVAVLAAGFVAFGATSASAEAIPQPAGSGLGTTTQHIVESPASLDSYAPLCDMGTYGDYSDLCALEGQGLGDSRRFTAAGNDLGGSLENPGKLCDLGTYGDYSDACSLDI